MDEVAEYFEPPEQFIARRTGLGEERVRHIQEMAEPWPIIQAFSEFFSKASQDARATGTSFFNAVMAHSQLLDVVGIGDHFPHLQPEILNTQIQRVAALTGEEEETIEAVQLALHDYMKMVINTFQEVVNQKRRESSP